MVSGSVFRAPPAVLTDVPVLVLLIVAWVTVPVFWAHVATGLTLIGLIAVHLTTRRRVPLRTGAVWRRLAYAAFLLVAVAMAATGLMRLAGMPPEQTWHGGISYLAMGLAAVHLWSVRRVLRTRIRAPNPTGGARHER
ncbi:MAG TPA: hypothetical protein VHI10_15200 [Mycobacterium sp.]|nr:hypothetical protein [Mycobacterium sp.]